MDVLCFVTAALLNESDTSFSTTCVKSDLTSVNIKLLVAAIVWSNVENSWVGKVSDHPRVIASRKKVCSTHSHALTSWEIGCAEPKTFDVPSLSKLEVQSEKHVTTRTEWPQS